jgi:hypothetical protein
MIHDEMHTAVAQAETTEDTGFDNSRTLIATLIRTPYTRRLYFLSKKLLLAHYGLIFAHLFVQNNTDSPCRKVEDRLTVGAPLYAPRATTRSDKRIPLRMEGAEAYIPDCYAFYQSKLNRIERTHEQKFSDPANWNVG